MSSQSFLRKIFQYSYFKACQTSSTETTCSCPFYCGVYHKLTTKTVHMFGIGSDTQLKKDNYYSIWAKLSLEIPHLEHMSSRHTSLSSLHWVLVCIEFNHEKLSALQSWEANSTFLETILKFYWKIKGNNLEREIIWPATISAHSLCLSWWLASAYTTCSKLD